MTLAHLQLGVSMHLRSLTIVGVSGLLLCGASLGHAQGTRLLRQPTVSATQVAFTCAGDVWIASRDGGAARRLTSFPGVEADPLFSPDGMTIAFTGEYGSNVDVYVVEAAGGQPRRLTWHPGADRGAGWLQDGSAVVFASGRASPPIGLPRFWKVPAAGSHIPTASLSRASNFSRRPSTS